MIRPVRMGCTACPRLSAKTSRGCTSTGTASRPFACASAPRPPTPDPPPHPAASPPALIVYAPREWWVPPSLTAPMVGHSIIYGVGDNAVGWWDNHLARHIGYQPQDSSERFRSRIESSEPPPDMTDRARIYQGGIFVRSGPLAK